MKMINPDDMYEASELDDNDEEIYVVDSSGGTVTNIRPVTLHLYDVLYHVNTAAPWLSTEVFVAGCYKNCPGCFNQALRRFDAPYKDVTIDSIVKDLVAQVPYKCVSFSGGEPMLHAEGLGHLAEALKQHGFTITCLTGYQADEVPYLFDCKKLLYNIDVLIDGLYIPELKRTDDWAPFIGSSNQRVINMPESLKKHSIVLWTPEDTRRVKDGMVIRK